ncbi:peptidase inhibitor family I36 protein [Streptomyces griseobrunneus]|uniref:peptidase inhibitor family I36 protein n=1 Tax=Streptomyces microflavus TaxID=1919 RepID=UPI0037FB68C6
MSLRRSLFTLTAAVGLTMSAALTAPATAAPSAPTAITAYQDCPVNRFCVWTEEDGWGQMWYFRTGSDDLRDQGINDDISSVWNRTGGRFCTWVNINRDGAVRPVGNWQGNTAQYSRNNNISSL